MSKGVFSRNTQILFKLFFIPFLFLFSYSTLFASGGTVTYVDSSGLNPRASPEYVGGYTVETFTTSGTFTMPTGVTSATVLIVGGGGGGLVYYAPNYTGGGGAGGVLYGTLNSLSGSYGVTVGAGGSANNGGNSAFGGYVAYGGGYATGLYQGVAANGGSGGGACCATSYSGSAGGAPTQGSVSPLTGYGNYGGSGYAADGVGAWGGGGGGAGSAGGAAGYGYAGSPGAGVTFGLVGYNVTYAAGGYTGSGAGAANTGNGGGAGSDGGSGIVVIRYLTPDTTAPTHDSITVSSNNWKTDNSTTYNITMQSTETGVGFGGSYGIMGLINYQGENSANNRGYFAWHPSIYVHALNQIACTGGGYGSKSASYGASYINLISCSTSVVGNQRTVVFTVRPDTSFGDFTDNDISFYTSDANNNYRGWTNFDTNFKSDGTAPTTSGGITGGTLGSSSWYTTNVTYTLSAADATSGVASTVYCIDTSNTCTPGTSYTVPLTLATEIATNYVRWSSTDNAGNVQTVQSSGAIKIDKTAPTPNTISINAGEMSTTNPTTTLTLSSADTGGAGMNQMQFSCDNATWSTAEAYATTKVFNLTNFSGAGCGAGYGTKTVYVRYSDLAGNLSSTVNDTITYVNNFPTVSAPTATSTTETTAILGSTIDSVGVSILTARGVCYGVTPSPTTNCTAEGGTATGTYTQLITGLATSTTYYYRGYATNASGTTYSSDGTFTTKGITNSLMFDSAQSQYLSRTPSVNGNANVWTWSGWVKRGTLGTNQLLFSAATDGSNFEYFRFEVTDELFYARYVGGVSQDSLTTTAKFRDPSAWLHVVVTRNGATRTIYVNNVQVASGGNSAATGEIGQNKAHSVGRRQETGTQFFDGYMSDTQFVDGQALTPSYFGESDNNTGNWIPKVYTGTYGVNGFHLNFSSSTALGLDTAPLTSPHTSANTWTVNGGITSANNQVIDTPFNNFTTLNPIGSSPSATISKGALMVTTPASGTSNFFKAGVTIVPNVGKWYFESTIGGLSLNSWQLSISGSAPLVDVSNQNGLTTGEVSYNPKDANATPQEGIYNNTSSVYSVASTAANNDVIGVAFDADARTIQFYRNNIAVGTIQTINFASQYFISAIVRSVGGVASSHNVNFGQKAFTYTPPSGFKALSTVNLPTPTILKPNQHFDVVTWTGDGNPTKTVSGMNFMPDFTWSKERDIAQQHVLTDINRSWGTLASDATAAEYSGTTYGNIQAITPSGFTATKGTDPTYSFFNRSSGTYVAWNWKGGNATTTNTSGSIISTVSANPTAGFSVVTYTGNGSTGTVGHGLGTIPKMVITKIRNGAGNWMVFHTSTDSNPHNYYTQLNTTSAKINSANFYGLPPTSSVIYLGSLGDINSNGNTYVSYVWSEVPGYSKFGSYTGNSSTDGPFVYTGFKPRYVMWKRTDSAGAWLVIDSARQTYNAMGPYLLPNSNQAEATYPAMDFVSNGFKIRCDATCDATNTSGATYVYAAFAESVMVPNVPSLPSVSSPTTTSITETSVIFGGNIDSIGSSVLTSRGICYGSTPAPTTNCTSESGTGVGAFTVAVTNLATSTTYYYRAYATNSYGTTYSSDSTFTTKGTTKSLLFNGSQSQYLSKTFGTPTNRDRWTWSGWVKRSTLGSQQVIFMGGNTGSNYNALLFGSDDKLQFNNIVTDVAVTNLITTQVFRDPSAWMHIVAVYDSNNATAADRAQLYINGTRVTAFSTATYPNSGSPSSSNASAVVHTVGKNSVNASNYFDGYFSDTQFIDGQALTPSSFGESDSSTGNWIPKAYTGTYGANGFHLNFGSANQPGLDTALIDSSHTRLNTWEANGGITGSSNQVIDTPLNNFATLNPLQSYAAPLVGASVYAGGASNWQTSVATLAVNSGKWYWETSVQSMSPGTYYALLGIVNTNPNMNVNTAGTYIGGTVTSYGWLSDTSLTRKYNNAGFEAYGTVYANNDTVGIALDMDAGTLTFYKNNVSQGVAYSGLSGYFSPAVSAYGTSIRTNFGQKSFAYAPPTGFKSLSTANLPTPTILKPNQHFDIVNYVGTGATQSISSLNFQPDLVWLKGRTGARVHGLWDSARGGSKYLTSNGTNAEVTDATNGLQSFSSSGFSVASVGTWNTSAENFIAWNWKAGNATTTNTSGSITSTVSANPTAGFSVVKYTGTGGVAGTVGHGLGSVPKMIIQKNLGNYSWQIFHTSLGGNNKLLQFDTGATYTDATAWNNTAPTASVFSIGTANSSSNGSSVAYVWSEVEGYSKFGSYTGNGSADGPFIYTGFKPRYIMFRRVDGVSNWAIRDTVRNTYNPVNSALSPTLSDAEWTGVSFDVLSNGFKVRDASSGVNGVGETIIYAAFAESSMIPTITSANTPLPLTSLEEVTITPGNTQATIDYAIPTSPNFTEVVVLKSSIGPIVSTLVDGNSYLVGDSVNTIGKQISYTTPGSYSWTVPAGVTSVSTVAVGAGGGGSGHNSAEYGTGGGGGALAYVNNISVTPGESLTVYVGTGGTGGLAVNGGSNGGAGGDSYLGRGATKLVHAGGGAAGVFFSNSSTTSAGGTVIVGAGGAGGHTTAETMTGSNMISGGGGAGGYSGAGGAGNGKTVAGAGGNGTGGGGGGGTRYNTSIGAGGGGGVGIYGEGSSGSGGSNTAGNTNGKAGSSGTDGIAPNGTIPGGSGGLYGGGGGSGENSPGGSGGNGGGGAVRIIWGPNRSFPSTDTGDVFGPDTSTTVACIDSTIATSTFDSCTATGLSNGTAYYFKVFTKGYNGNYTAVETVNGSPAIPNTGVISLSTVSYRLRNDDGDEVTATYSNNENTAIANGFVVGDKRRVRFVISNQTDSLTNKRYQIEYALNPCVSWTVLPRPDEMTNQHFRMEVSTFITDNGTTTHSSGISAPVGKSFVPGRIQSFNNLTYPIILNSGEYTEIEYAIRATKNITPNTSYCFRITSSGDATNFTYVNTPQITSLPTAFRYQGGGSSGSISSVSILNVEEAVVVATTTVTGGTQGDNTIATSTTVETIATTTIQQSTTTSTRKRGGSGSSGSLMPKNEYAYSGLRDTINFMNLFIKELVNYQVESTALRGYAMQECNLKSLVFIETGECEHLELYGDKKSFNLNILWSVFDKLDSLVK